MRRTVQILATGLLLAAALPAAAQFELTEVSGLAKPPLYLTKAQWT